MKKFVILTFALLLVLAFAAAAAAETKVAFEGSYRVRGWYMNNFTLQDDSDNEDKSSYFDQRFRLGVKFYPADNLVMNINLQALKDNKWGTQPSGLSWKNKPGALGGGAGDAEYNSSFEMYRAYMQIKTPFGRFDIGRMSGGTAGLIVAGQGGSPMGEDRYAFDSEGPKDRIKFTMASGPFLLIALYEKVAEQDWTSAEQELDHDFWAVLPQYKFANGAVNCLFLYGKNNSTAGESSTYWVLDPALTLGFGGFTLNAEMKYLTGKMETADVDLEGLGFYFDAMWNYGMGELGLWYMWTQGDDDVTDDKVKGRVATGGDFCPLLIVYDIGLLNDANNNWSLGLWVDHNITEKLMLHAAFGYVKINETEMFGADVDDHFGNEFDVGLVYKIFDNLTYEALFGYFVAGDFNKFGVAGADVGNAMAFRHVLTMSF